jgi:hypothetical protein
MFPIAQSPSTGIVASCKGEDFASPDNIEAFAESCRQIVTIYKTMPPEVQKAFLIVLEWVADRDLNGASEIANQI